MTPLTKQFINEKTSKQLSLQVPYMVTVIGPKVISKASSDTGMAGDTGCWLGPQLGLSPKIPVFGFSVWSGIPQNMVAKSQKTKH